MIGEQQQLITKAHSRNEAASGIYEESQFDPKQFSRFRQSASFIYLCSSPNSDSLLFAICMYTQSEKLNTLQHLLTGLLMYTPHITQRDALLLRNVQ